MMGYQPSFQHKRFVMSFNLEKRIRNNHILRKILEKIDFDFIYKEVQDTYGENGNVSTPPPVIVKMMLLLVLYNVRSERENSYSLSRSAWTGCTFSAMTSMMKYPTTVS